MSSNRTGSGGSSVRTPGAAGAALVLAKKRGKATSTQWAKHREVTLDTVLGLSGVSSSCLAAASDGNNTCIAYAAGCTVVVINTKKTKQSHVVQNSRKPIVSLCLSSDGRCLAVGEKGHHPVVRTWDMPGSSSSSPTVVSELKGHDHEISCVAFSPNQQFLVSVGNEHDKSIFVWSWRNGLRVASNKITSQVYGLAFAADGCSFVTASVRRIRYWYFNTNEQKSSSSQLLTGRSAVLGALQNNCFVAVACGRSGTRSQLTYALTRSGLLCLFDAKRQLVRYTEVKAGQGFSLGVAEGVVVCGCEDGVVRAFHPTTLDYVSTLPRPHPLTVDLSTAVHDSPLWQGGKCADTTSLALDPVNHRLVAVYNDHSLYVWDITDPCHAGKTHSFLYHSSCVWDLTSYPLFNGVDQSLLPSLTFATCSSDATVRFWNLEQPSAAGNKRVHRNIYSKELLHTIYGDVTLLKEPAGDGSSGIKCVRFHPSGHHVAVGDREGNLRVYNLQSHDLICEVVAHDSEILSLEYSPPSDHLPLLLATASRDRLIHVFNVSAGYSHVLTLVDHTAAVTSVKFAVSNGKLFLLSCGADKSILFWEFKEGETTCFQCSNHLVERCTMYGMIVDPGMAAMGVVGQDRLLRIHSIANGKCMKCYKSSASDDGSVIRIALDPSGSYVATSSSTKNVSLVDFESGDHIATLSGHAGVVTALCFSQDCRYLFTGAGDSCIFVWKLPPHMVHRMCQRIGRLSQRTSNTDAADAVHVSHSTDDRGHSDRRKPMTAVVGEDFESTDEHTADFRFSISHLPVWAKRKLHTNPLPLKQPTLGVQPGGKWAQEQSSAEFTLAVDNSSIEMECFDETDQEDDNDGEEREVEVLYLKDLTMQPSEFVTYPVEALKKQDSNDSQSESSSNESSLSQSPQPITRSASIDDAYFLETHFESLTADEADRFFGQPMMEGTDTDLLTHRPSISAKFFQSYLQQKTSANKQPAQTRSVESPLLPQDTQFKHPSVDAPPHSRHGDTPVSDSVLIVQVPASVDPTTVPLIEDSPAHDPMVTGDQVSCVQEPSSISQSGAQTSAHISDMDTAAAPDLKTSPPVTKLTVVGTNSTATHVADSSNENNQAQEAVQRSQSRPRPFGASRFKAPGNLEEEVAKARKRLEELGYPVVSKGQSTTAPSGSLATDQADTPAAPQLKCDHVTEQISAPVVPQLECDHVTGHVTEQTSTPSSDTVAMAKPKSTSKKLTDSNPSSLAAQVKTTVTQLHEILTKISQLPPGEEADEVVAVTHQCMHPLWMRWKEVKNLHVCQEETEEEDEKKAALKNFADKLVTETAKQIVHQFRTILDKNLQEKQQS